MRFHALLLAAALSLATRPPAEASPGVGTSQSDVNPRLSALYEALDAAEDAERARIARIAWWGDSAIVSDGYTGRVRARLQQRFGDAGPGFALMATTFPGYLRKGVRLKRHDWKARNIIQGNLKSKRYGYGGIQSEAWGGASSTFETRGAKWDRVEVFHRAFPKAGTLQIFADGAGRATAEHDAEAVEAADAVWRWDAPAGGVDKVRVRAGGGGLSVVYGVALERGDNGVVLDSLGLLGMRARRWLKADPEHMAEQVRMRRPDLIVVNFGGNERVDPGLTVAGHRDEIVAVGELFNRGAPGAACLIVGPLAHGDGGKWKLDPALTTIYEAQRAAAKELGCAFFDTVEAMGGEDAIRSFRRRKLIGGDLAHLNGKGHDAVGDLIADWLIAGYDAWKAQR